MESTFGVTYAVGNDTFATKCFILGWVVWSYGYEPEPISGLDKDQAEYLRAVYVGPLYPDDLKKAIQDRLDTLANVVTSMAITPGTFKEFEGDSLPPIKIDTTSRFEEKLHASADELTNGLFSKHAGDNKIIDMKK